MAGVWIARLGINRVSAESWVRQESKGKRKECSNMSKTFMKCVSCYLVFAMFVIGIVPRVDAGLSPSEVIALSQIDRTSDLEKIQEILETKMIRTRLEQLGFSQDEIQARLTQLNDQQVHQLALNLDKIKVGGNGFEFLVVILLIAIVIVLYLQYSGRKVVIQKR